ncbi:MAG: IS1182 family transposase [Flavobacteriales bacterium]
MSQPIFKSQLGLSPSLFPENIFDKIPENHPVYLVNAVVDSLDISYIMTQYKGGGASSYHPKMMIKILFYSYLSNVYSCRKIEKALKENIYFMWLSGMMVPNFRTINDFRSKRLKNHIHQLFSEVVLLLQEMGYVSLDIQYTDGTKVKAVSNKYSFVWRGSVEKHQEKLKAKVKTVINDIESHIQSDNQDKNKDELPQDIDSEKLRNKLSEIYNRLKKSDKALSKTQEKQLKKLQEDHLPRLEKYENQLETLGDRNRYSKTDEDATFMRMKEDHMKNGQLKPSYNIQISTENQFITYFDLFQKSTDTTLLIPYLQGFKSLYNKQSSVFVADAGYGSLENYEFLERENITAFVKYNYFHYEQKRKIKNNPFLVGNLFYNALEDFYICPLGQRLTNQYQVTQKSKSGYESKATVYQAQNCSGCPMRGLCHKAKENRKITVNHRLNELKQKAKTLLNSEEGLRHRSNRPIEPEAVFGQMKFNNKFTRFTLKGLEKTKLEFGLMAIGHNLRKLVAKIAKNTLLHNLESIILQLKSIILTTYKRKLIA